MSARYRASWFLLAIVVVGGCVRSVSRQDDGSSTLVTDPPPLTSQITPAPDPSPTPMRPEPSPSGCGRGEAPFVSEEFTPFSDQWGSDEPTDVPQIRATGQVLKKAEDAVSRGFSNALPPPRPPVGTEEQLILLDSATEPRSIRFFYGRDPITDQTLPAFLSEGGIVVSQTVPSGQTGAEVKKELGDQAGMVPIGPYDAALNHADPIDSSEFRPYHLYWSDAIRDWTLIGGVARPEDLIDFARSFYCG